MNIFEKIRRNTFESDIDDIDATISMLKGESGAFWKYMTCIATCCIPTNKAINKRIMELEDEIKQTQEKLNKISEETSKIKEQQTERIEPSDENGENPM
jgi:NADH:ubiquinone oxidoreductase subunit B-like Fe-S oxidoreductase